MQKKIERGKVQIATSIDKIVRIHPHTPIPVSDESAVKKRKCKYIERRKKTEIGNQHI